MRVAIVGSRYKGASEATFVRIIGAIVSAIQAFGPDDILVSGGAKGVDELAAGEARGKHIIVTVEPAWDAHGKGAGHRRNAVICRMSERMVAIWDGESRGTANAIETMRKLGKSVEVVEVK